MGNQKEEIEQLIDRGYDLVESGQTGEAYGLFQKITEMDPSNGEAWMMKGSINAEQGNSDDAMDDLNQAIKFDPTLPESYYYMATIQHQKDELELARESIEKAIALDSEYGEAFLLAGRIYAATGLLDAAEKSARQAVAILPASADANYNLGFVLMHNGNTQEASKYFSAVTQLQPGASSVWSLLAQCLAKSGDIEKSCEAYRTLLQLKPDSIEAYYGLGYSAYMQGQYREAVDQFTQALQINSTHKDSANGLGTAYQAMGQYVKAIEVFDQLIAIDPESAEGCFGKARALIDLSKQHEAMPLLQRALILNPDYMEARLNLAATLLSFEQPEQAKVHCETILATDPDSYDAIALLARIELQGGDAEDAYQRLNPHILAGVDHINLNIAYGDICKSLGRSNEAVDALEKFFQKGNLSVSYQRNLHFCLGQLHDKLKAYDSAFTHFQAGNQLRVTSWDRQNNAHNVSELIRIFSKDFLDSAPQSTNVSEKPLFVLGMPRSGTSLVEQILASHPLIHGAGELPNLFNMSSAMPGLLNSDQPFPHCFTSLDQPMLESMTQSYLTHLDTLSPTAARVTDKMPGNFSFLGMIQLLFPGARIIHCLRDPVDTCLSCYFQDFAMAQPYSFDLTHLGLFYKDYERLMAHWKNVIQLPMMTIQYEDLVSNQEAMSRELVAFSGLEWDDNCLDFHETKRYVATSSYDQVKRPMYTSSVKRWKNYEQHLEPLIKVLSA